MKRILLKATLLASTLLAASAPAGAGQAPGKDSDPDVPISHRDRVYAAEQFSNTVSVTDPADNKLLGVIRLGDPQPGNLSPLYRGQVLVHGMGFSFDHKTIAVVAIATNSVTFIDTATNSIKHTTYLGRAPHEGLDAAPLPERWHGFGLRVPRLDLVRDVPQRAERLALKLAVVGLELGRVLDVGAADDVFALHLMRGGRETRAGNALCAISP